MTKYIKQSCPLCGAPAEYYWVDSGNRKYFNCSNCTYFQISKRAELLLAKQTQDRRSRYAREAQKVPAEHLLTIIMPDAEFRKSSDDVLQVRVVSKAELPLR